MAGRKLSEIYATIEARLETVRLVRMESERLRIVAESLDAELVAEIVEELGEKKAAFVLDEARESDEQTADRQPGRPAMDYLADYFWSALTEMGYREVLMGTSGALSDPSSLDQPIDLVASVPVIEHVVETQDPPVAQIVSIPKEEHWIVSDAVVAALIAKDKLDIGPSRYAEANIIDTMARRYAVAGDRSEGPYDTYTGKSGWKKKLYRLLLDHRIKELADASADVADAAEDLEAATEEDSGQEVSDAEFEDLVVPSAPSAEIVRFSQRASEPLRIVPTVRPAVVAPVEAPAAEPDPEPEPVEEGPAFVLGHGSGGEESDYEWTRPFGPIGTERRDPVPEPEQVSKPIDPPTAPPVASSKVRDLRPRSEPVRNDPVVTTPQSNGLRAGYGFNISAKPKPVVFENGIDPDDDKKDTGQKRG